MTPALIAQIHAIARVCVTTEMSNTELLAVQRALVDAWEALDRHLRPPADTALIECSAPSELTP